jgi:hypothetical protein
VHTKDGQIEPILKICWIAVVFKSFLTANGNYINMFFAATPASIGNQKGRTD